MHLLGIHLDRDPEHLYSNRTSFKGGTVHIRKPAGGKRCGCTFDRFRRKHKRGREDTEGTA